MCKTIITLHGGLTRECQRKITKDGYCTFHHPEAVEDRLLRELWQAQSQERRIENQIVGAYLRATDQRLFEAMLIGSEKGRYQYA